MAEVRLGRAPMFGDFVVDAANGCLWRGGRRLAVPPKDFAVLEYLVAHAGRLVPADELFTAVWRNASVHRAVLKVAIGRIRRTLGDDAAHPRFIENIHGRGYRFVRPTPAEGDAATPGSAGAPELVVGRDADLSWLVRRLDAALGGTRQIVLVSGEPGIGKTTLLETFGAAVWHAVPDARIAWGRCVEQRGAGEPYVPLLEALGQLCRAGDGEQVVEALGRHAPTWLLQLPGAITPRRLAMLRRRVAEASRARMLRELADALAALAAAAPVVLCLEDLQWSDPSTLDFLAMLAGRREAARLLVLGTHRPLEPGHALAALIAELRIHDACTTLDLAPLDESAVGQYLEHRFGADAFDVPVRAAAHARTAGNPLYLVHLVEALLRRGWFTRADGQWRFRGAPERIADIVPETVGDVIAQQVDALKPGERRLLEAASLTRTAFSAATIAAALETTVETADHDCAELARRRQLLRVHGVVEWPDGTVAGAYDFAHPLYRAVLRDRVPPAVARAVHGRLATRLEAAFGPEVSTVAVELAEHCEEAGDLVRATGYRRAAAATAVARAAYREAAEHLARALALWRRVSSAPDHQTTELRLQIGLANLLQRQHGSMAPEVVTTYRRARLLWRRAPRDRAAFRVALGLFDHHMARAELPAMRPLARQLSTAARRTRRWDHRLVAHNALARVAFWTGDLRTARIHYRRSLALARAPGAPALAAFDIDAATVGANLALVLWCLGDLEQASRLERDSLALVRAARNPRTLGWALGAACFRAGLAQDAHTLDHLAREMLDAAGRFELEIWGAPAERFRRWALVLDGTLDEAVAELRPDTAAALSANLWQPLVWNALAEGCARAGRIAHAESALDAAERVLRRSGTSVALAEWHRCRAVILLASGEPGAARDATRSLRRAIAIARRQGAVMFEIRATLALVELRDDQERRRALAAVLRRLPERAHDGEIETARRLVGLGGPDPRSPWRHPRPLTAPGVPLPRPRRLT